MSTLPDFEGAVAFAIPAVGAGRLHEGLLVEGPQGWGEFSPRRGGSGDGVRDLTRWLTAATEPGTVGWPDPVRGRVPVALAVPLVAAPQAAALVHRFRGRTVDVAVSSGTLADDVARVAAVRAALGTAGAIRCVAKPGWDVAAAVVALGALDEAAAGLEYVELSGWAPEEFAAVRRRVDVRIALDASGHDGSRSPLANAADVAVLRTGPLGGVRRALRVAEACGLPCVVSSSGESSVGLASGVALAGALPELPFACGLGTIGLLAGDLVADARSLHPVDGHLPVAPMPPGPDRDRLAQFAQTDSEARARWLDLLDQARQYA